VPIHLRRDQMNFVKVILIFIAKSNFTDKSEVCSVVVFSAGLHDPHLYLQFH